MKNLIPITFDYKSCIKEIDEYKSFLKSKIEFEEAKDILLFFKQRVYLSTFIGSYFPNFVKFDLYSFEFPIVGDFRCDLAIGDSKTKTYCFIEFEDAKKNSVFIKKTRSIEEWSPRFEHGFSQIIDWYWKLDDFQNTKGFRNKFGEDAKYYGLLIVGRSAFLNNEKRDRIKWRMNKVLINSMNIYYVTLDDLLESLLLRIEPFRLLK